MTIWLWTMTYRGVSVIGMCKHKIQGRKSQKTLDFVRGNLVWNKVSNRVSIWLSLQLQAFKVFDFILKLYLTTHGYNNTYFMSDFGFETCRWTSNFSYQTEKKLYLNVTRIFEQMYCDNRVMSAKMSQFTIYKWGKG